MTGDYKTAFNKGKQAEVEDRYKHSNKLTLMREATKEEKESVNKHIRSISKITEMDFYDSFDNEVWRLKDEELYKTNSDSK